MSTDLKDCPFCGGRAYFLQLGESGNWGKWFAGCTQCWARTPAQSCYYSNAEAEKQSAADAWNRRA